VPDAVFELLALALARCPQVRAVFVERIETSLQGTDDDAADLGHDLARAHAVVERHGRPPAPPTATTKATTATPLPATPLQDPGLAARQERLLEVLFAPSTWQDTQRALLEDPVLLPWRSWLAKAEPRMVALAAELVQTWGRRDDER
jgi:hypothetical protein